MKCRYLDEIDRRAWRCVCDGYADLELNGRALYDPAVFAVPDAARDTIYSTLTLGRRCSARRSRRVELTPEGTGYRAKTRFAKFNNLPELMAMFKQVADIKTADMLRSSRTGTWSITTIAVKPSVRCKKIWWRLSRRTSFEKIMRAAMWIPSVDNMLRKSQTMGGSSPLTSE